MCFIYIYIYIYPDNVKLETHFIPTVTDSCNVELDVKIKHSNVLLKSHFSTFYSMYLPNPSTISRVWHEVNFQAEYTSGLNSDFSSPRLVVLSRLKDPVCLTIHPELEKE